MRILLSIFQLKYMCYLNQEKGNIEVPTPLLNAEEMYKTQHFIWVTHGYRGKITALG